MSPRHVGGWDSLPEGLLARILDQTADVDGLAQQQQLRDAGCEAAAAARLVCSAWRRMVDNNLHALAPRRWPGSSHALPDGPLIHACSLDLAALRLVDCAEEVPAHHDIGGWDACGSGALLDAITEGPCYSGASSSKGSGSLDLLGAAVLQPKACCLMRPVSPGVTAAACTASDGASKGEDASVADGGSACIVSVRATRPGCAAATASAAVPGSLTCFVASMWPEAVPHAVPHAALRLWRALPACLHIRQLRLSGSMLAIQSVSTAVAGCDDAAAALSMLQQMPVDQGGAGEAAGGSGGGGTATSAGPLSITHTYRLQLPARLCAMTGLQALAIDWSLTQLPQSCSDGGSPSAGAGGPPVLLVRRRRSYEGGGSPPTVRHVADPAVVLPCHFGARLALLQSLELGGSVLEQGSLLPLQDLRQLQELVLGPGHVNMQALVALAAPGVLGQLTRLGLKQQGAWQVPELVAVLAATRNLQRLQVQELEMSSAELSAAGALQEVLTIADVAALTDTLTSLCWSTCSQRLLSGASLLCRGGAAAAVLPGPGDGDDAAAAGPWLGGLVALQCLHLQGVLRDGSLLGAPALEALSGAIGGCTRLRELRVHALGLPALPAGLARLPHLRSVSIRAAAVTRRSAGGADAALAVLGRCAGLRDLTLSGCELRHVPAWLAGLNQLEALQLRGNYIQDLPAELPRLGLPPSLREVDLSDNRLRHLPPGIAQLRALRRLVLDSNYLTSLPGAVWGLPALQVLSVRENMLPELPECAGGPHDAAAPCGEEEEAVGGAGAARRGGGCSSSSSRGGSTQPATAPPAARPGEDDDEDEAAILNALGLVQRQDAAASAAAAAAAERAAAAPLPSRQRGCACGSSLTHLSLADNQLTQLPGSMAALTALQHLDLTRNQLRALPDKAPLWELSRLTALHLADNHLTRLPAGLAKLQRLVELDVSGNHMPALLPRQAGGEAAAAAGSGGGTGRPAADAMPPAASATATPQGCSTRAAPVAAAGTACCSSAAGGAPGAGGHGKPGQLQRPAVPTMGSSGGGGGKKTPMPCPLAQLPSLQLVKLGRQQAEGGSGGHQCPLQLLLAGLAEVAERIRCLAPPSHQCPVAKAAAAAVAHLKGVRNAGKRARAAEQQRLLEQCMRSEPGWVVLPAAGKPVHAGVAPPPPPAAALGPGGVAAAATLATLGEVTELLED